MMEGVLVKLNPGLPWQKLHLKRRIIVQVSAPYKDKLQI
jgi:hypothetical protein